MPRRARLAHRPDAPRPRGSSVSTASLLALTLGLGSGAGLVPRPLLAAAGEAIAPGSAGATEEVDAPSPDGTEPATEDAATEDAATEDAATEDTEPTSEASAPEDDSGVDALHETNDDDATDEADEAAATEEDDDEAEADSTDGTKTSQTSASTAPPPLRPLQTAAWWTMFGAFALGTTAGVLSGLTERQEDRATRLSTLFESDTGSQPLYADRKDEYEGYLRRGEAYARAAIGVGVVSGVAAITAVTLFAIDARRQRNERPPTKRASLRWRPGGMEVRF